jgi:hypothetical protein
MNKFSPRWIIILAVYLFLIGLTVRLALLPHTAFAFDTQLFYEWGTYTYQHGFATFWQQYPNWFDYFPGAVHLFGGVAWLSHLIDGSYNAFLVVLKTINLLVDLGTSGLVFFAARRYGFATKPYAFLLASLFFCLPAFWFISSGWGQIDGMVISASLLSVVVLYEATLTQTKQITPIIWAGTAGILFSLAFWTKMQAVLVLPIAILVLIIHRHRSTLLSYVTGLATGTFLLVWVPLTTNPQRLFNNLQAPFIREPKMSYSGNNFWILIDWAKETSYPLLTIGSWQISLGMVATALFVTIVGVAIIRSQVVRRKHVQRWQIFPSIFLQKRFRLDLTHVLWLTSVLTIAYFVFMPKMYERYLYAGALSLCLLVAVCRQNYLRWRVGAIALGINISLFLNALDVYEWWNYTLPSWLQFIYIPQLNVPLLSSALVVCALAILLFLVPSQNRLRTKTANR